MRSRSASLFVAVLCVFAAQLRSAPQVAAPPTAAAIQEAIRLSADDKAARRFLDAYVVQTRAGWGNGPLIGSFSTPFSRVVQAAAAARRKGEEFTSANVAPDLIAPELHIVATSQTAQIDNGIIAHAQSVALAVRDSTHTADVVLPVRTIALTKEYQDLTGTAARPPGVVAIFPLSVLRPNSEIRVGFDRVVRGSSGASACQDCTVPLDLSRIR
jgi:hypothetical protein